jgi:hypothetical protein
MGDPLIHGGNLRESGKPSFDLPFVFSCDSFGRRLDPEGSQADP